MKRVLLKLLAFKSVAYRTPTTAILVSNLRLPKAAVVLLSILKYLYDN